MDNEYRLKITDSVSIPVPLEMDTDYAFVGTVTVHGDSRASKEDGSFVHTMKARFFSGIELIKGEQVIKAKDKGSNSQKMRRLILSEGNDYDRTMAWLMQPDNWRRIMNDYEADTTEDTEAIG